MNVLKACQQIAIINLNNKIIVKKRSDASCFVLKSLNYLMVI